MFQYTPKPYKFNTPRHAAGKSAICIFYNIVLKTYKNIKQNDAYQLLLIVSDCWWRKAIKLRWIVTQKHHHPSTAILMISCSDILGVYAMLMIQLPQGYGVEDTKKKRSFLLLKNMDFFRQMRAGRREELAIKSAEEQKLSAHFGDYDIFGWIQT